MLNVVDASPSLDRPGMSRRTDTPKGRPRPAGGKAALSTATSC